MASRNGKVFGQTVDEATTPPTPTPLTDFTAAFGAVTVDCASVAIQGNANVFVTVRTDTDQLLEVGCTLNNFPTSCGGTVVNLGVVPTLLHAPASVRSSGALKPEADAPPKDGADHRAPKRADSDAPPSDAAENRAPEQAAADAPPSDVATGPDPDRVQAEAPPVEAGERRARQDAATAPEDPPGEY